jgi:chorismate dehydratase
MSWETVLGRVAFANCDPIFDGLEDRWKILPAPPAWLTGHLLRRDCLTAPIPAADYAKHSEELLLLPGLGIVSNGDVGSVILFGTRPINQMRDIALPSDSSTSRALLQWVLGLKNLDPRFHETGPDLVAMLEKSDGALLIGDRALIAAKDNPNLVKLDLGAEWTKITGFPMVFGVFAARKDSPVDKLAKARKDMVDQYNQFLEDTSWNQEVISRTSEKLGFSESRIDEYFSIEVQNKLDDKSKEGLEYFLKVVCNMSSDITWLSSQE